MAQSNIKKSQVWLDTPNEQNIFIVNNNAKQAGKRYFAFRNFIYITEYPLSENIYTGFTVTDLVEESKTQKLAREFCEMNAGEQGLFFNEVASIFHSWGNERELNQLASIAHSGTLRYGKYLIESLYELLLKV